MTPIEELALLLRPAGAGIHTVSTGRAEQERIQRRLYGQESPARIEAGFRERLERLSEARVVILAIPSDCGAGLVRGASFGPQALRVGLYESHPDLVTADATVLDVGDVAVIPHLLHDEMVSDEQKRACRAALYPGVDPTAALPVSPLSIAERALERIFDLNPTARLLVLGGDHSVAWPVVAALERRRAQPGALGIVQPDAHTDLLPARLGVRYCFATWAYHANDLLGRGGRLVQVGIRASGKPRSHWEETLGVRQLWASEIAARGADAVIDEIVAHLHGCGVRQVYFSNDIDATDAGLAPATGAPEPDGLSPGFITALVARLGTAFDLVAADLCEVAPPVGAPAESARTVALGVSYLAESLRALLGTSPR